MSTQTLERSEAVLETTETERQIVALHLADEIYGVDIAHIHTIIVPQAITHVPKAPFYVKGVMNLRGRIVPVIDLRERFGMPAMPEEKRKASRIVIVETEGLTAGLIVDAVSEVLRLPTASIQPPSQLVASVETDCITGIGRIAGRTTNSHTGTGDKTAPERLIILLDVYKTLTTNPQDADILTKLQKSA